MYEMSGGGSSERRGGPGPRGGGRGQRRGGAPRRGRGRRGHLSREQIVAAAIEIAKEEGVAGLSMRKVAARLGVGTMSLYHYVHTKRELLALMDDAIMGELVIPEDEMPVGWRDRIALIARLSLAAWMRRPWMLELVGDFRITENGLRHFDQTIGALDGLEIDPALKIEIMVQVDDYVFGFVVRESAIDHERLIESGEFAETTEFVEAAIQTGGFPHVAAMVDPERDFMEQWLDVVGRVYDQGRFERGLNRLLDGIEAELERLGALPSQAGQKS